MRVLAGVIIGATIITLWHTLGWPWIGWLFTRIPPVTPDGHQPKMRAWKNGVLQVSDQTKQALDAALARTSQTSGSSSPTGHSSPPAQP